MNQHENLHHYVDCGLDNVYLESGYEIMDSPYGQGVSIADVDGLHKCIAKCLIEKSGALTGKEFRFLRIELDFSQEAMGELCGVNDRTVRKWESDNAMVAEPANTIAQVIYAERYEPNTTYEGMRQQIKKLQLLDKSLFELRLSATSEGWEFESDVACAS